MQYLRNEKADNVNNENAEAKQCESQDTYTYNMQTPRNVQAKTCESQEMQELANAKVNKCTG